MQLKIKQHDDDDDGYKSNKVPNEVHVRMKWNNRHTYHKESWRTIQCISFYSYRIAGHHNLALNPSDELPISGNHSY